MSGNKVTVGNLQMNVVDQGSGRPLLLVHGFPLDHTMWQGQIAALASEFRVISPDLRGFGQSIAATSSKTTMREYADELAQLLDALEITEPVVFCGLSMGGYVAWQFYAHHRQRLAGLIVCDSRAVADNEKAAAGRLETATKVETEGSQVVADAMLPKLFPAAAVERDADFVTATKKVMLAAPPAGVAAALRGMAERPDFTKELAKIDVPTLIICGAEDAIAPPAEMKEIAETIPGAKYVSIAGAGHMAPLEKPAEVNAAISAFLKSLPK
ncbi:Arylesterase [Anatilimnocola aggregata]|uniref:Arylesterase n=1 Tax=Anatilimnocola aggregata TaxID=2528021 RepID=A0A517YD77_9BACT|nr:alpha/beta fold hydrolase [Anatilimnocola aggregata]QDU28193.1 Arylesterase [Anatilimnocola aggregata]